MPITKVITDPEQIAQQLVTWLEAPEENEEEYDGFDIDPYDDARERGS